MDPLGEYFATSGCDGNVNIYKLRQEEVEFIKKIKVLKGSIETFGKNPFEVSWTPDGDHLIVSGEMKLGFLKRD